ncbi:flavin reductase family protein [Salibacterium qingdaonense]|uniref:NADH-FMN oxidoreductase RutF, flavin reductase (DIM6/NTAB) family n=1 Tax=Salibacterium qingdaonense TaxID=266892 RepID=A0A1I4HZ69_9BACI|nr:flavin reductase family protein [Salibacterium qingdaonense]SFL47324.1 NADH-FMN oxidoreductase RutF, flavin reductase (DIM6/NTAB) family [Salibacterium qingdaonense]
MDDRMFKTAMGKFATGVTVITTEFDDQVRGMTANAFMSVSIDPKLVLISVANKARMLDWIKQSGHFAVNILSESQQDKSMIFAGQLQDREVEFERFEGLPVIEDSLVTLACDVYETHLAGDHTLFVGAVKNLQLQDRQPLTIYEGKYKDVSDKAATEV